MIKLAHTILHIRLDASVHLYPHVAVQQKYAKQIANCIFKAQYSVGIDESFIYKVKVLSVNKYILCTYLQRKQVYFTAIR